MEALAACYTVLWESYLFCGGSQSSSAKLRHPIHVEMTDSGCTGWQRSMFNWCATKMLEICRAGRGLLSACDKKKMFVNGRCCLLLRWAYIIIKTNYKQAVSLLLLLLLMMMMTMMTIIVGADCAKAIGNEIVRWYNWHSAGSLGWPFPMVKYKYIFQIKYTEAIYQTALGNCYGLKLPKCLWLIAV